MRTWFGTDGIRGRANELLTGDFVFRLGQAAGAFFCKHHEKPVITIGTDTRVSSPMLERALSAGLMSVGVNVVLLGVIPTPGVAYETKMNRYAAGVVISASHNPFEDNGIKFFNTDGYKLSDRQEEEIEYILKHPETILLETGDKLGQIEKIGTNHDDYISFLIKKSQYSFNGIKIIVDSANGAASSYAKRMFETMGAHVISMHDKPSGININAMCGSTHTKSLQEQVIQEGADLGIALDGDADRLMVVDELGNVVDGDDLLYVFATHMHKEKTLANQAVVVTIMSNYGLIKALESKGIEVKLTAVGDRYVIEEMKQGQFNLGGESSGHLIFGDHNTTGDGMMAAIELLNVMKKTGKSVSALTRMYSKSCQYMNNVKVKNKTGWNENDAISAAILRAQAQLEGKGRVLVRASGTEQLIRVMAEGPNQTEIETIVSELSRIVHSHCS